MTDNSEFKTRGPRAPRFAAVVILGLAVWILGPAASAAETVALVCDDATKVERLQTKGSRDGRKKDGEVAVQLDECFVEGRRTPSTKSRSKANALKVNITCDVDRAEKESVVDVGGALLKARVKRQMVTWAEYKFRVEIPNFPANSRMPPHVDVLLGSNDKQLVRGELQCVAQASAELGRLKSDLAQNLSELRRAAAQSNRAEVFQLGDAVLRKAELARIKAGALEMFEVNPGDSSVFKRYSDDVEKIFASQQLTAPNRDTLPNRDTAPAIAEAASAPAANTAPTSSPRPSSTASVPGPVDLAEPSGDDLVLICEDGTKVERLLKKGTRAGFRKRDGATSVTLEECHAGERDLRPVRIKISCDLSRSRKESTFQLGGVHRSARVKRQMITFEEYKVQVALRGYPGQSGGRGFPDIFEINLGSDDQHLVRGELQCVSEASQALDETRADLEQRLAELQAGNLDPVRVRHLGDALLRQAEAGALTAAALERFGSTSLSPVVFEDILARATRLFHPETSEAIVAQAVPPPPAAPPPTAPTPALEPVPPPPEARPAAPPEPAPAQAAPPARMDQPPVRVAQPPPRTTPPPPAVPPPRAAPPGATPPSREPQRMPPPAVQEPLAIQDAGAVVAMDTEALDETPPAASPEEPVATAAEEPATVPSPEVTQAAPEGSPIPEGEAVSEGQGGWWPIPWSNFEIADVLPPVIGLLLVLILARIADPDAQLWKLFSRSPGGGRRAPRRTPRPAQRSAAPPPRAVPGPMPGQQAPGVSPPSQQPAAPRQTLVPGPTVRPAPQSTAAPKPQPAAPKPQPLPPTPKPQAASKPQPLPATPKPQAASKPQPVAPKPQLAAAKPQSAPATPKPQPTPPRQPTPRPRPDTGRPRGLPQRQGRPQRQSPKPLEAGQRPSPAAPKKPAAQGPGAQKTASTQTVQPKPSPQAPKVQPKPSPQAVQPVQPPTAQPGPAPQRASQQPRLPGIAGDLIASGIIKAPATAPASDVHDSEELSILAPPPKRKRSGRRTRQS